MSKLVLINFVRVFFKELPILMNPYRKFLWHYIDMASCLCSFFCADAKKQQKFSDFFGSSKIVIVRFF